MDLNILVLIDTAQLDSIAGQAGESPEMRSVLGRIWRESFADACAELAELKPADGGEQVRITLHRVRGLLAMWGFGEVSKRLKEVEQAEDPAEAWALESPGFENLLAASARQVGARYEWLEADERRGQP